MTEELQDLGRRAVACKHWRCLPGVLADDGHRLSAVDCDGLHPEAYGVTPDFSDPATRGCLLELVRDAWGDLYIYVLNCGEGWFTVCSPAADGGKWLSGVPIDGPTEAAALVAALEAAP